MLKNYFPLVFGFFFLMLYATTVSAQNNINKSPALELLLTQIEKQFVPQHWNKGMDEIAITIPQLYVTFLGTAMRKQEYYLDRYPGSTKKFMILNAEIESLIPKIANAYNYANASKNNGKKINTKTLEGIYYSAIMGDLSENFLTNYKKKSGKDIRLVRIPFMIDKVEEPLYNKAPKKDDAIVLLGEEVHSESSRKELGAPTTTGLICPMKSDKNFEIDTNDNPIDKTYIKCSYYSDCDGLIREQYSLVNDYKHGEFFSFFDYEDNCDTHFLYTQGQYNNGKKDGIWKKYRYTEEAGKALLWIQSKYDNGLMVFEYEYYRTNGYRDIYLHLKTLYVQGKRSEATWFYKNDKKRMHVTITNGKSVKDACWEEDGTPFPCPSYW